MKRLRGGSAILGLGGLGVLACGGACGGLPNVAPPLPGDGPGPGAVFPGAQCDAVRPQTEPDLMGWDPGQRANLHDLRGRGVVAVRYVSRGCNVELEVLSSCIGAGSYTFTYYPESQSKTLKSARELFAEMPISAARLSGKLKGNRALRTDYEIIGTASLPPDAVYRRAELKGPGCASATHVVSKLYLGGFAMIAGEERQLEATAKVFGAGAEDHEGASIERIDRAGDAKACAEAGTTKKEAAGCQVPLRLGLLALEDVAPTAAGGGCPAGMVAVPGGTFKMGKRGDTVTVSSFCMDVNEVTVDRYAACAKCSKEHLGETSLGPGKDCNHGVPGRGNHPINCVDWNQAAAFCSASDQRLPMEEEWEWAARGGAQGTSYPWGEAPPSDQACWDSEGKLGKSRRHGTCPVGSFPSGDSPLGIHDLAGNAWEWTAGRDGDNRVRRGGSWADHDAGNLRATDSTATTPGFRDGRMGFRCARSLP